MAQDPVLQREMFNTRGRSAKGSGITSMVDDGSSGMTREERLQMAKAMLAEAQMKQTPEYYFNTLAASDRPAMTRPVASSAPPPAMQQMPAAQQMAQMQAAGVRPVGMADGGIVRRGFAYGGINNAVPRSSEDKISGDGTPGFFNFLFPGITGEDVYTPPNSSEDPNRPNAPMLYGFPSEAARDAALNTPGELGTSLEKLAAADPSSGVSREEDAAEIKRFRARAGLSALANKSFVETQKDKPKDEPKEAPADRKQTALEAIKAEREAQKDQNFNMALMQAGLAMMAGKSPNALQNIAEGGISGLAAYTGLEKSDRETALSERKLGAYEDSLRRSEDYNTARALALSDKAKKDMQNIAIRAEELAGKELENAIKADNEGKLASQDQRENWYLNRVRALKRNLGLDLGTGGGSAGDTFQRDGEILPEMSTVFPSPE